MRLIVSLSALATALLAAPAMSQITVPVAGGGSITTKGFKLQDGTIVPGSARTDAAGVPVGTTTNPDVVNDPGANTQLTAAVAQLNLAVTSLQAIVAKLPATPLLSGGSVAISNYPATQTVNATAWPLPSGASTETTLASIRTLLGVAPAQDSTLAAIKTLLGQAPAQDATLQAIKTLLGASPAQDATLQSILTKITDKPIQEGGTVAVSNLPANQAVTVTATPLPPGAATDTSVQQVKTALGTPYQAGGPLPLPAGAAADASIATLTGRINALITALGSPQQAGGAISNTGFAINGTLPAFAAPPTVNLGTLNGAATSAKQDTLVSALGSPFQAGGSIANTAFGISGTLPSFATTQTFNLGTLGGAATSAKQDSLLTALGAPFQAGASIGNLGFAAYCSVIPSGDATWTTTSIQTLPCTTTGRVRVGLSSAALIGGTLATYADLAGYLGADGTQKPARVDANNNQTVVQRDTAGNPMMLSGSKATGQLTAVGTGASIIVRGDFNFSLWGTGSWTCQLERSFDRVNSGVTDATATWLPRSALDQAITYAAPTSTSPTEPEANVYTRVNCTAVSGTVNWRISQ